MSRRGVDAISREDIVQEVALRVVEKQIAFDSADDLVGWALTVGHNLWTDDGRRFQRRGRLLPLHASHIDEDGTGCEVPASSVDVAAVVEHRLALEAVLAALTTMSPADRGAIVSALIGRQAHGRKESIRLGVRRHRVRKRLRPVLNGVTSVLDGVAVVVVGVRLRLRALEHRLAEPAAIAATLLVPAVVGLVLTPAPPTVPANGEPVVQRAATTYHVPLPAPGHHFAAPPVPRAHDRQSQPQTQRTPPPAARDTHPLGATTVADVHVATPDGSPLVKGQVREEPGTDDPVICVGNLPLLGARCLLDDGSVTPR